jgi:hypothetical protein
MCEKSLKATNLIAVCERSETSESGDEGRSDFERVEHRVGSSTLSASEQVLTQNVGCRSLLFALPHAI